MGQALYRKYRSKTLGEVVGQEHITDTLASAIKSGRISHAYLFTGPRGVGKTSVARILAHEINKLPYSDSGHLDIIEIDAASNRRIDDIRDLREKVHIAPGLAKYKVYIIDEVHMLTGESFNALLKTLEEPPKHVVFILATTEAHKLPATIISRTQRYSFRPVEFKKVVGHLKFIANQEGIKIDDEALQIIAEHGEGSFRDSISVLDQIANISGGDITAKIIEANLGLAPKSAINALVLALQNKDHQALISQLDALQDQGATTASLVPQLIRAITAAAAKQPGLYQVVDDLIEVPRSYNPQIKLLTALMRYILKDMPEVAPTKHAQAVAQTAKPVLEATKTPHQKTQITVTPPTSQPIAPADDEPKQPTGGEITELTMDQWAQILAEVKKQNTPLQSILRQATPHLDAATQTLTLTFRYALHSRKIDDAKGKEILVKATAVVLGSAPMITTVVDSKAQAPDVKNIETPAQTPELDDTAKNVADLMGGGEVVSA